MLDQRLIPTLVKMVQEKMLATPRWARLLGVKNAFEAQKTALEKGSFQTITGKQVRFRVEAEELIFPAQSGVESEIHFKLEWFKEN